MPADLNIFKSLLLSLAKDERVTVWHMALMFGIVQLAEKVNPEEPIFISRRKVMQLSHINSIVTYHKCMKELQQFGYIHYAPSYHPAYGSMIHLLKK